MKVRTPAGEVVEAKVARYFGIPMLLVGGEEFAKADVRGWELVEASEEERSKLEDAGYEFGLPAQPVVVRRAGSAEPIAEVTREGAVYRCGRIIGQRLVDEQGRQYARVAYEWVRGRRSVWLEFELAELGQLAALVDTLACAEPVEVL